jgi:uncharacterized protein YaaQ
MKLLVAIVQKEDAGALGDELIRAKFSLTKLESVGGFLKEKNNVFLLGVEEKQIKQALDIIKEHSQTRTEVISSAPPIVEPGEFFISSPVEVEVGGATVFILDVDQFKRL